MVMHATQRNVCAHDVQVCKMILKIDDVIKPSEFD